MKKHRNLIVLLAIIIFLIVAIFLLINSYHKKEECSVNFDDILDEINLAISGGFTKADNDKITMNYALDFSNIGDYIMGINDDNSEYFIIFKGIKKEEKEKFIYSFKQHKKSDPEKYKKTGVKSYGDYTYLVVSSENYSTIDGIIRSFILCS